MVSSMKNHNILVNYLVTIEDTSLLLKFWGKNFAKRKQCVRQIHILPCTQI